MLEQHANCYVHIDDLIFQDELSSGSFAQVHLAEWISKVAVKRYRVPFMKEDVSDAFVEMMANH